MKIKFLSMATLIVVAMTSCQKQPEACFTASKTEVDVKEGITFTDCSKEAVNYKWDFGDGTTSTEKAPKKSFEKSGTYTVKLTTTSKKDKKSDEVQQIITVKKTSDEMIQGNWKATFFTEDGVNGLYSEYSDTVECDDGIYYVDYTETFTISLIWKFQATALTMENNITSMLIDRPLTASLCETRYTTTTEMIMETVTWVFSSDKKKVTIDGSSTLDVVVLTETNFELNGTLDGAAIVIKFQKI